MSCINTNNELCFFVEWLTKVFEIIDGKIFSTFLSSSNFLVASPIIILEKSVDLLFFHVQNADIVDVFVDLHFSTCIDHNSQLLFHTFLKQLAPSTKLFNSLSILYETMAILLKDIELFRADNYRKVMASCYEICVERPFIGTVFLGLKLFCNKTSMHLVFCSWWKFHSCTLLYNSFSCFEWWE